MNIKLIFSIYNYFLFFFPGVTEEELLNKGVISPDDVLRLTKITESKYLINTFEFK